MMGMLIGVAALSAWGLHRIQELTKNRNPPLNIVVTADGGFRTLSDEEFQPLWADYMDWFHVQLRTAYREIFLATAVICVLGALAGLLLGSRRLAARTEQPG
jgi:hypothetical protein